MQSCAGVGGGLRAARACELIGWEVAFENGFHTEAIHDDKFGHGGGDCWQG
jgi:hypothetical protein